MSAHPARATGDPAGGDEHATSTERPARVNPALDRIAAHAWRIIVISIVAIAALWLLRQVRVVFFPVVVATFFTRALSPVAGWLRRHKWRPGLAAIASMAGLFAVVTALLALTIPTFADELDSIGPTLTTATDDIEDWLVDDSPVTISRDSIDRFRERAGERVRAATQSSDGALTDRATLVAEALTGTVLAVILTFFMLRDGERFTRWSCERLPLAKRARARSSLDAAWSTLAGYLRGATLLGALEAVIIGITLLVTGGSLIAPVMLITFLCAFVPVIGAILAGVIAVLVALVTGGIGAAIAVAIVAFVVQQFDNDLLAPIIYGRSLSLHPVVILLSVVAGGALFGLAGTVLAVPTVAVAANATRQYRADDRPPIP